MIMWGRKRQDQFEEKLKHDGKVDGTEAGKQPFSSSEKRADFNKEIL